jgi:CheY-like chemotaxis protein
VYGIVRQSGGAILVNSKVGEGSEFTILLPHSDKPLDEPAPEKVPVSRSGKSELILVTEDEEVVRDLMCAVLEDAGYTVICAASPHEAIEQAGAHSGQIKLLVSDVVMPEMHGPALARAIEATQPGIKVLFVSGYSENDISDQGVIEPGLNVLQKPFTHSVLISKVQELLAEAPVE